jgi:inositol phosphorylceramide synthase catalytic subunit
MAPTSEASVVVQQASPTGEAGVLASTWRRARRAVSFMGPALTFATHMSPLLAAGVVYELLRGLFHHRGSVHVADLYALEARLFAVSTSNGPRALSEVLAQATTPWLDALCGVTYFLFLIEVVAVAAYLYFARSRSSALELTLGFFFVNLLGWLIWFVYPAAPPWYVDQYGTGPALLDVVSSPGGLERVDAWLGLPLATVFYSKSANVFGAMPSLHMAYATLVALVAARQGGWLRAVTLLYAGSMALSAVYLRHHYILDVLAGVALALLVGSIGFALRQRSTAKVEQHSAEAFGERA